jgi:hypothetical protein
MVTQVPERFTITDSAMKVIRSLVAHPHHVAYVCWKKEADLATGETTSEGWSVVSFEERACDEPVEVSGVRFLFDPYRAGELVGKKLHWIDGRGFILS